MTASPFPRRSLLAGVVAAGLTPAIGIPASNAAEPLDSGGRKRPQLAYVGSRTTAAREASGSGITLWRVPADARPWQLLQTLTADDGTGRPGIPANPTFLAFSADGTRAYCTHGDLALASSFTVDPETGRLTHLNTEGTGHPNPVHLSISPDGRWLVLANFAVPGDLCTLPINADGSLGPAASRLQLPGEAGRTRGLQDAAHPHHVPWDPSGRFILVPDRGQDVIHTVTLDSSGTLSLHAQTPVRPADGPRHLLFHPHTDLAYVVNEISCSVTTCRWDPAAGTLDPVHALRTAPPTDLRDMTGAEIAITADGEQLFVSNRSGTGGAASAGPGNDSVTVMTLGRDDGIPDIQRTLSTLGQRPRFIGTDLDSRNLYMANEISGTITHVSVRAAGTSRGKARLAARTGSPVCIVFRPGTGAAE